MKNFGPVLKSKQRPGSLYKTKFISKGIQNDTFLKHLIIQFIITPHQDTTQAINF